MSQLYMYLKNTEVRETVKKKSCSKFKYASV